MGVAEVFYRSGIDNLTVIIFISASATFNVELDVYTLTLGKVVFSCVGTDDGRGMQLSSVSTYASLSAPLTLGHSIRFILLRCDMWAYRCLSSM